VLTLFTAAAAALLYGAWCELLLLAVNTLASGKSALKRTELETRRAIRPLTLRTE